MAINGFCIVPQFIVLHVEYSHGSILAMYHRQLGCIDMESC